VKFDHDLAYERGVDCVNCHGDLIRGKGEVPRERCTVCHNREEDLARINDHQFMHKIHVTEHKVDCLECHLAIQHSLDPKRIQHAAADCKSCHPDHHREQVSMLLGMGGKTIPSHPSGMSEVRVACPSCHRVKQVSPTGTVLWKASIQICTNCHQASEAERLRSYHEALRAALPEIESGIARVREALKSGKLSQAQSAQAAKELQGVQSDWNFLRVGNDIHNIHYASSLTRALVERLSALCRELKIKEPKVTLPKAGKSFAPVVGKMPK
jgi:predicted CXXCH cytochrome family protein